MKKPLSQKGKQALVYYLQKIGLIYLQPPVFPEALNEDGEKGLVEYLRKIGAVKE